MNYTINDISAALMDLSSNFIDDSEINMDEEDKINEATKKAENIIINQLMHCGLNMASATQMVEDAFSKSAKSTDKSNKLLNDAVNNRYNLITDNDNNNDDNNSHDQNHQETMENDNQQINDSDVDLNIKNITKNIDKNEIKKVKIINNETNQNENIAYTVKEMDVKDIFTNIPKDDELFNFKVPYIEWSKPHPSVPKIDMAYNMEVESLLTCLYAVSNKKSVALVGPHGSGKTKLTEQIAARLNMPFTVLPMDGQMSKTQLFGQEKLRTNENGTESYYQYGVLPTAMLEPGIIVFDEFDRADDSVQYACHSVYEQTHLLLVDHDGRKLPLHKYNRVFGTANTKGRGSDDGMYIGGNEMSEATRDRWSLWIDVEYQSIEDDILVLKAKIKDFPVSQIKIIARLANSIRESFNNGTLSQTCSMRQQLEAAEFAKHMIKTMSVAANFDTKTISTKATKIAIEKVIIGRSNDSDKGAIEELYKIIDPDAYK